MSRPRAGLVVSKAVGGSVVRHRVSRRLRHLLAPRLSTLPAGSLLVVRALPPSASASSAELAEDLDSGLNSALRKASGARRG
jgi:ribonuclease P protein component